MRPGTLVRLALVTAVTACSGDTVGPPIPRSIELSDSTVTLDALGESLQLTALVEDEHGNALGTAVVWTSDATSVATVRNGLVTAVKNGSTMIRASASAVSTSIPVTVDQVAIDFSLSTDSLAFESLGLTHQLDVTATDANGHPLTSSQISGSSSDTLVARVAVGGAITTVGNGDAMITIAADDFRDSVYVSIDQKPAGVRITPIEVRIQPEDTLTLVATLADAAGTPMASPAQPIWVSDDTAVVTVSAAGSIRGKLEGGTHVTASIDTFDGVASIRVGGDSGDLGVGWIQRSPSMDFVMGSTNPTRDGWPTEGQIVTWQAHVKNWSATDRKSVGYRWTLDGVEIATGTIDIPAGTYVHADLPRAWSFTRETLAFELDPANWFFEVEERNNTLEVFTDAISAGFYVEQSLYDFFARNQSRLGVGSNSWEDWAQRHVRMWNQMFADALYPLTPNGVRDRIRLDKITIVPDGALPLVGGLGGASPHNHPNLDDRSVDLQWGFPATWVYSDLTRVSLDNPFYFDGARLHELGHARYLVDVYGFNVWDGQLTPSGIVDQGSNIAIVEDGSLIVGTSYMPIVSWNRVFYTDMPGLMSGQYSFIDEYSAVALNLIAGHRAVLGNVNASGNLGVFLEDLPAENRLTVRGPSGVALAGASVELYQAAPTGLEWYGKYYDDTPEQTLVADGQGRVLLGRNPFGTAIVHTYGHSNGVLIVRVGHAGRVGYGFLEAWRFNMEYWRGHTDLGEYTLDVNLR